MKYIRAILIGAMIWAFIFFTFGLLSFVPMIKESLNQQALLVAVLIVPYAMFGASVFYKNGNKENGVIIGVTMALTALVLDALITVPLLEIPNGRTYQSFYSFPLLWLLVFINISTIYFFWKLKVKEG